jgi:uncharacterized protein YjcR
LCCGLWAYNKQRFARARKPGKVAVMLEIVVPTDPKKSPDVVSAQDLAVVKELTHGMDPRRAARAMYWRGYKVHHIAKVIGEKYTTVYSWKRRDKWEATAPFQRIEAALDARLQLLIAKTDKTGTDFKEIDLLGRQIERMARVDKYSNGGNEADLNPKVENRNAHQKDDTWKKKRDAKKKADAGYSEEQVERLVEAFHDEIFDYQKVWYQAGLTNRIRNLLKSRQIGATWYFAREALVDAIETGRNQIFLSASKAQAHVFKQYIVEFAKNAADIELRGDPIKLPNDATLYFLGTNSRTAQSYHGNLYFDEYFWVAKFQELRKVASGMAIHSKWRQTYFSTPSSITHDAYPFWNGDLFNKGRAKDARVKVDITHEALKGGMRGPDGQWRQIVTVEDALAGGCTLFDLEQLRLEYSPAEFDNLLMCLFMDDSHSVFGLSLLMRCFVDAWVEWDDFKPFASRPFGYRQVWIGYDPSNTGDRAALVVVAPPLVAGGKFRILEKIEFHGLDYTAQADRIEKITKIYNVGYIGIDSTGIGSAVYQLVRNFFPAAEAISYSPDVKARMVLKTFDVMTKGRLQFDAGWTDLAASFMSIKKAMTPSGRQITYQAGRSEDTSHADLAWATMHAVAHEPLEGITANKQSILEIY